MQCTCRCTTAYRAAPSVHVGRLQQRQRSGVKGREMKPPDKEAAQHRVSPCPQPVPAATSHSQYSLSLRQHRTHYPCGNITLPALTIPAATSHSQHSLSLRQRRTPSTHYPCGNTALPALTIPAARRTPSTHYPCGNIALPALIIPAATSHSQRSVTPRCVPTVDRHDITALVDWA